MSYDVLLYANILHLFSIYSIKKFPHSTRLLHQNYNKHNNYLRFNLQLKLTKCKCALISITAGTQIQSAMKKPLVFTFLLAAMTIANSAPVQPEPALQTIQETSQDTQKSKLISSIDDIQRKYARSHGDDSINSINVNDASSDDDGQYYDQESMENHMRQSRMFGFYPYYPSPYLYPVPVYYPPEFYDDFSAFYGGYADDEDIMSRTPGGQRRRPAGQFKNSPIYYIRLPPTPYMFVPGLGYISQPPTYTPMIAPPVPPVPSYSPPVSQLYNLPINFLANGKPTNIYSWPANQFGGYQQQRPQYQQSQYPQMGMQQQVGYPQMPAQRPQRPYNQRPYNQNSKVSNLNGQFMFNGRPDKIFLLPNNYNPMYRDPYNSYY